jgi:hypothetical protein
VDATFTYDLPLSDFENATSNINTTLTNAIANALGIPASSIQIISISSASSRRRILQTTGSSSNQTIVVIEITYNSGSASSSYANASALQTAINAAISSGSLAIEGMNPTLSNFQVKNGRNVRLIVGLSVGLPLGFIAIVIIVYICYKRSQKREKAYHEDPNNTTPKVTRA